MKKNRIIAIYGKIGHGKDEVGRIIASHLKNRGEHSINQRFAFRLKQFASTCFNIPLSIIDEDSYSEIVWDFTHEQKAQIVPHYQDTDSQGGKIPMTLGRFLQLFATECVRTGWDENFWANCTLDHIREHYPLEVNIITDLRFPNELELLKKQGAVCIYVDRPCFKELTEQSGRDSKHSSETSLDDLHKDFTLTILNDGSLEDLSKKVEVLYPTIINLLNI